MSFTVYYCAIFTVSVVQLEPGASAKNLQILMVFLKHTLVAWERETAVLFLFVLVQLQQFTKIKHVRRASLINLPD